MTATEVSITLNLGNASVTNKKLVQYQQFRKSQLIQQLIETENEFDIFAKESKEFELLMEKELNLSNLRINDLQLKLNSKSNEFNKLNLVLIDKTKELDNIKDQFDSIQNQLKLTIFTKDKRQPLGVSSLNKENQQSPTKVKKSSFTTITQLESENESLAYQIRILKNELKLGKEVQDQYIERIAHLENELELCKASAEMDQQEQLKIQDKLREHISQSQLKLQAPPPPTLPSASPSQRNKLQRPHTDAYQKESEFKGKVQRLIDEIEALKSSNLHLEVQLKQQSNSSEILNDEFNRKWIEREEKIEIYEKEWIREFNNWKEIESSLNNKIEYWKRISNYNKLQYAKLERKCVKLERIARLVKLKEIGGAKKFFTTPPI